MNLQLQQLQLCTQKRRPMSKRLKYRVEIRWHHRRFSPQFHKTTGEGTSIRRAINNALLGFFSPGGKDRRDAHVYVDVRATRTKDPADT